MHLKYWYDINRHSYYNRLLCRLFVGRPIMKMLRTQQYDLPVDGLINIFFFFPDIIKRKGSRQPDVATGLNMLSRKNSSRV